MFLAVWLMFVLLGTAFGIVFGLVALVSVSIVRIYGLTFNDVADEGARWSLENLFGNGSLTPFKEFFTGGSE